MSSILEERSNNIKDLKHNLQSIINNAIDKYNYEKIVIFIDDLDRLVPERAVELLEVLKLFLDCEHCVFVLAIDYNVVVRGVKGKYGDDLDDAKGKAFFEKIIQVPFTVPVANYDIKNFIENSLQNLEFSFNEETSNTIIQLIRNSIGNNPRSINRLFNSVSLLKHIMKLEGERTTDDQLLIIAIVCFQLRFEEAYTYILSSYNNSPEDAEETENYLMDLLENSFELSENGDYNSLVSIYGEFNMRSKKDKDDFGKFYKDLKSLLGANEQELTLEQFEKFLEKMTLSNAVAIGNADTVNKKKQIQNHAPNEDVQYVIRKLFNHLVNKEHFDLSKPEFFGKEDKESRDQPIASEFIKITGEYNQVRLTQGKGQGLNIYSSHNKSNSIYTSGDTYGRMINDGMGIQVNNKLAGRIQKFSTNYLASELRNDSEKYKEFEKEFIKSLNNLLDTAKVNFNN